MHGVLWLVNFGWCKSSQCVVMHISPNFCAKDRMLFFSFLKIVKMGMTLFGERRLFSCRVVLLAASAHKQFLKKEDDFPPLSMAHTLLKRIATFYPTWPFYWGVPGAVYSNLILIPSCLQTHSSPHYLWHHCTVCISPEYHTFVSSL